MAQKFLDNSGIALAQLAIGLVVFGLVLTGFIVTNKASGLYEKERITQERLAKIQTSIGIFIQRYGRAPCVARQDVAIDTAEYARELSDCTATPAGTSTATGLGGLEVKIGAVPARSLNIPDDHLYDGWGNQFTFVVTEILTQGAIQYQNNEGAVFVEDAVGDLLTDKAMYVILSHGEDGNGAISRNGTLYNACVPANLDGENCDVDAGGGIRYRTSIDEMPDPEDNVFYFSMSYTTTRYDDFIRYSQKEDIILSVIKHYEFTTLDCNDIGAQQGNPMPGNPNCSSLAFTAAHDREKSPGVSWGVGTALNDVANIRNTGKLMYSVVREAKTTGKLIVRATIPIRYDNRLAGITVDPADPDGIPPDYDTTPILDYGEGYDDNIISTEDFYIIRHPTKPPNSPWFQYWELAIHAAVYIDGNLVVIGDVINPSSYYASSGGPGGAHEHFMDSAGGTGSVVGEAFVTEGVNYTIEIYLFSSHTQDVIKNVSAWAGTIRTEDYDAEAYVEFLELGAF